MTDVSRNTAVVIRYGAVWQLLVQTDGRAPVALATFEDGPDGRQLLAHAACGAVETMYPGAELRLQSTSIVRTAQIRQRLAELDLEVTEG